MNAIRLEAFRLAGLALCGMLWAAGPAAAAEEKSRLAVLTWEARNASPEEAEAVTEQVRAVLTQSGRFLMVDRTLTAKILEEWERQQSGLNEAERAVRVGKLYNVRFIVAGKLIRLDARGWLVSSAMLDAETGVTSGAQTLSHQGEFFPLLGMIPALTARLAGLETAMPPTTPPPVAAPAPPPPVTAPAPAQQQAAISTPQPGTVWREPITGMEFVHVPGGEYEQGCGPWTSDCREVEKPVRRVRLSPFWIGKTEVTQGQWTRVMGSNPSWSKNGDDYPVENVSWNDVQEFIRRLNSRATEVKFRLPSEAEWEYACRDAGKPVKYAWGGEEPRPGGPALGNIADEQSGFDWRVKGYNDGHARTSPVGSFPENGLGLFDMSGNVWEWVQDVYNDKAYQSGATSDPIYQGPGALRVARGGGWFNDPRYVRCSNRFMYGPGDRGDGLGFRLSRTK